MWRLWLGLAGSRTITLSLQTPVFGKKEIQKYQYGEHGTMTTFKCKTDPIWSSWSGLWRVQCPPLPPEGRGARATPLTSTVQHPALCAAVMSFACCLAAGPETDGHAIHPGTWQAPSSPHHSVGRVDFLLPEIQNLLHLPITETPHQPTRHNRPETPEANSTQPW